MPSSRLNGIRAGMTPVIARLVSNGDERVAISLDQFAVNCFSLLTLWAK